MTTTNDPAVKARKLLILDHPWYGFLSLQLQVTPDETIPTACTNGKTLRYNPAWFGALPIAEQLGVIAHEVEHCALGHLWRMNGRDPEISNIAADHVVNLDLRAAGFRLPEPHYADPRFWGMGFEKVYAVLIAEKAAAKASADSQPEPKGGENGGGGSENSATDQQDGEKGDNSDLGVPSSGVGGPDPANWGEMEPPSADLEEGGTTPAELQNTWEKAVETVTNVATAAGTMSDNLKRTVAETKRTREDLVQTLQQYITSRGSHSYSSPNRRFLHRGIRLPGRMKSAMEAIVIGIDTSGSINGDMLTFFRDKTNEVMLMDEPPENIYVIYCDAEVRRVDHFTDGQIESFNPVGGGGTLFAPFFDYLEKEGITPDVMMILTDLENGGEVLNEPSYPVLWVTPIQSRKDAGPFGETIKVDPYVP